MRSLPSPLHSSPLRSSLVSLPARSAVCTALHGGRGVHSLCPGDDNMLNSGSGRPVAVGRPAGMARRQTGQDSRGKLKLMGLLSKMPRLGRYWVFHLDLLRGSAVRSAPPRISVGVSNGDSPLATFKYPSARSAPGQSICASSTRKKSIDRSTCRPPRASSNRSTTLPDHQYIRMRLSVSLEVKKYARYLDFPPPDCFYACELS